MLDFVQHWVLQAGALGALGFFVGAVLEELALPFPSPLLLIGVAFFVGKPLSLMIIGKVLIAVILPIVIGATTGSFVIYAIAYSGGKSAIDRFGKYVKISWRDVERFEAKLKDRKLDTWALFLSRCLPFTPTTVLTVLAGVLRMNPWLFIMLTFVGIFVRVSGLFIGALVFSSTIFR